MKRGHLVTLTVGGAALAVAGVVGAVVFGGPAAEPAAAPAPAGAAARYTFDAALAGGGFADSGGGGHTLRLLSASGGRTAAVAGSAVFPPLCPLGKGCPRAVLETRADALNPGSGPVSWGAVARLDRRQTSSGQNLLQKGYSRGGSQFKLQVDGTGGHPSCVVVDRNDPRIYLARSSVGAADGRWHRLECHRSTVTLTITVDGVVRGQKSIPAGLTVNNAEPLRLGGKGVAAKDNDQFHGALDEAWVSLGG